MKALKNYIYEGLLDDMEDVLNDTNVDIAKSLIIPFIKENYSMTGDIEIVQQDDKFVVNILSNINRAYLALKPKKSEITNGKFIFGKVDGDVDFSFNDIKTLEGAPTFVKGDYTIYGCKQLTEFDIQIDVVGGVFQCKACPKLKTLKGAPKKCGNIFSCHMCTSLDLLNMHQNRLNLLSVHVVPNLKH